jgi:large conductance mechanosensitive channel
VIKGFRKFIMRGNVVDLAVAVVIGAAFTAVVNALVKDIITPLIAAIFGKPDFSALKFTVNHSTFLYGDFVNAIVSFLLVAAGVYFVIVAPLNKLADRRRRRLGKVEVDPETAPTELEVLGEIRDLLRVQQR